MRKKLTFVCPIVSYYVYGMKRNNDINDSKNSNYKLVVWYSRRAAIHAEAPAFVDMGTEQEILETGIKVVDLLAPYVKGGKIGMLSSIL